MSSSHLGLLFPWLLLACSGGGGGGGTPSQDNQGVGGSSSTVGGAGGSTSGVGGSGDAGRISAGGVAGAAPVEPCPEPIDLGVRIVGRHDGCAEDGVRISWSGTGFVGAFNGTGVSVRLREGNQTHYYTALVDGVARDTLVTTSGDGVYSLAQALPSGSHKVEFYRRTEANRGTTTLLGVDVTEGALEAPPPAPERNLEVVGDSISCGYGNEGLTATCPFSPDTENHYLSYGALLARHFDAELSTVAWSGKGVVSNYGGTTVNPMPAQYERSVIGDPRSQWDFRVKPQAVIINLGTNDFSADTDPSEEDFTAGYESLLSTIRSHYPDAFTLCTIGPMLTGTDLETAQRGIAAAVALRQEAGDLQVEAYELKATNDNPGCDYHPNLATHQLIADELAAVLADRLGW